MERKKRSPIMVIGFAILLSLLLENDTPVNTVQRCAGHSKASVTVDIYGHAMSGSQNLAADTIDELVTPMVVSRFIDDLVVFFVTFFPVLT